MGLRAAAEGGVVWSSYLRLLGVPSDEYCGSSAIVDERIDRERERERQRNPRDSSVKMSKVMKIGLRFYIHYIPSLVV